MYIELHAISFQSTLAHFNMLVVPILSYGPSFLEGRSFVLTVFVWKNLIPPLSVG